MEVRPAKVVAVPPKLIDVDPTVSDELVSAELGMLVRVLVDPLIDLLVKVCVPVRVATVESIATVTADPPLKLVPVKPVPMVKALVVLAVIVPVDPKDTVWPLKVTDELVRLLLPMLDKVFAAPLIDLLVRV
jgi:hypothetical protein